MQIQKKVCWEQHQTKGAWVFSPHLELWTKITQFFIVPNKYILLLLLSGFDTGEHHKINWLNKWLSNLQNHLKEGTKSRSEHPQLNSLTQQSRIVSIHPLFFNLFLSGLQTCWSSYTSIPSTVYLRNDLQKSNKSHKNIFSALPQCKLYLGQYENDVEYRFIRLQPSAENTSLCGGARGLRINVGSRIRFFDLIMNSLWSGDDV